MYIMVVVHLVHHEGSLSYSCMIPYNNIIRHMKSIVGGRGEGGIRDGKGR